MKYRDKPLYNQTRKNCSFYQELFIYITVLGAPVGLQVFAGFLYYLSETNGTLYKMDMFRRLQSNTVMLVGLPKTNDLQLDHRSKYPAGKDCCFYVT